MNICALGRLISKQSTGKVLGTLQGNSMQEMASCLFLKVGAGKQGQKVGHAPGPQEEL